MKKWTQNLGWKIFSLVVAVFLWSSFARDAATSAFVSVPLEYKGLAPKLEISSEPVDSVSLDLHGSSEDIKRFSTSRSPVVLDFSGIRQAGERTFYIDERNVELPPGMKIERTFPAQLRFRFEISVSRDVPVRVRHSGSAKEGFQLVVTPPTVAIVGPESRVNRIEAADTDMIDLSNVSADAEFHVNAFIGDSHVRFKQPPRVIVKYFAEPPNG